MSPSIARLTFAPSTALALLAAAMATASAHASAVISTGPDTGGGPNLAHVLVPGATPISSFFAFAPSFTGGVRVASGDIDGDGIADTVAGAGPGGGPQVTVFRGTSSTPSRSFFAFAPSYTGGIYVAAGDLNGDGHADIITGSGAGGVPQISTFDAQTGNLLNSFLPFAPSFAGGVRVAAADINRDGHAAIIAATGPGSASQVSLFDPTSANPLRTFAPFDGRFLGGVFVAAGDVNRDGTPDIIVSAGGDSAGGSAVGPLVKVFDGLTLTEIRSFFAVAPAFSGGIRVASADVNADGYFDIITATGPGAAPQVTVFSGLDNSPLASYLAYAPTFTDGLFVAATTIPEPTTSLLCLLLTPTLLRRPRR